MIDNQGFSNLHYKPLALPLPQPRIYSTEVSHVNEHYDEASDDLVRVVFRVGPGQLDDFQTNMPRWEVPFSLKSPFSRPKTAP